MNAAARDNVEHLRTPPHSVEAEQAVLGGLMLDNGMWEQVGDLLLEQDFYRQDHRVIWRAMAALSEKNQPFDAVTLSEWLKEQGCLDQAGGLAFLATLARDTPTAANVRAYADIVRERAVARGLLRMCSEVSTAVYQARGRSVAELLELAQKQVFDIAESGNRAGNGYVPVTAIMTKAVEKLDELLHADSHITGVPTGLNDFDELTAGLQPGDLVIVAGRPSMGKTSFAMNIAEHAAIAKGIPTGIFSMEMSGEQLGLRLVSSVGRIDQQKVRTGQLDDSDWKRVAAAVSLMAKAPMYIDDTPGLSPVELKARARRMKREHGLGLMVVDYLQLMSVPGTGENRATEISEICRALKFIARELKVPVIALSQLNRKVEDRPDKRPVMSDLRESGSIEQDADLIVFIYRDEVYNKDSKDKGIAELIIGKQRNGPIDTVKSTFLGRFTRFENYAGEER